MLDGIFVHIHNIIQTWQDYFYLPIVVLRHIKEEHIKKIMECFAMKNNAIGLTQG